MNKLRRITSCSAFLAAAVVLAATGLPCGALAGPPYVTDDPEPAPRGEIEAYLFTEGSLSHGLFGDSETGVEVNYGALADVQLSVQAAFDHTASRWNEIGTGIKFRFLHETDAVPQAAFYPSAEFTRDGGVHVLLPLWFQKGFGAWQVFGGGGYAINTPAGERNAWAGGAALTREFGNDISLGAEAYAETASVIGEHDLVGVRAGASVALTEHFSLLASAGPEFAGPDTAVAYYIALAWHG